MRAATVTREDMRAMHCGDPSPIVAKLKAAGIVLEREACPVKIKAPWHLEGQPDGSIVLKQEES